jgi:peptidoglycan hydrolase-like protein with peptidoglycan-binding domain
MLGLVRGTTHAGLAAVVTAAVVASGCSVGGGTRHRAALVAAPRATTGVDPTTVAPTTAGPETTTAAPAETTTAAPPPGLARGDEGPAVLALEQRLDALHYEVGAVDGTFDLDTEYGVTAFQKVTGMDRSGRATDDVVAALATATPPQPMVPNGGGGRVEIDLQRQVLFLYEAGSLSKVLTISSGSGERFCSEGWCRRAITPQGAFAVYSQHQGWETSPLGRLYNAQYFNEGIAIHGSPSVPADPASHGCIRIPMDAAEWFPSHVSVGTPVYVVGDEGVPAPYVPPPPAPPSPDQGAQAPIPAPVDPATDLPADSPPPIVYTPPAAH